MGNKENFLKAMLATAVLSSFVCSSTVEASGVEFMDVKSKVSDQIEEIKLDKLDLSKDAINDSINKLQNYAKYLEDLKNTHNSNEQIETLSRLYSRVLSEDPQKLGDDHDYLGEFRKLNKNLMQPLKTARLYLMNLQKESSTKIQKVFRGYNARKELDLQKESAIKIQSVFRGYSARKDVDVSFDQSIVKSSSCDDSSSINTSLSGSDRSENELSDDQLQNASATQIQKIARGYNARNELKAQKESATNYMEKFTEGKAISDELRDDIIRDIRHAWVNTNSNPIEAIQDISAKIANLSIDNNLNSDSTSKDDISLIKGVTNINDKSSKYYEYEDTFSSLSKDSKTKNEKLINHNEIYIPLLRSLQKDAVNKIPDYFTKSEKDFLQLANWIDVPYSEVQEKANEFITGVTGTIKLIDVDLLAEEKEKLNTSFGQSQESLNKIVKYKYLRTRVFSGEEIDLAQDPNYQVFAEELQKQLVNDKDYVQKLTDTLKNKNWDYLTEENIEYISYFNNPSLTALLESYNESATQIQKIARGYNLRKYKQEIENNDSPLTHENLSAHNQSVTSKSSSIVSESISEGSKSESEIDVSLSGGSESDTSDLTEENLNKLEGENLSIHSQSVTSKSSSIVSESISEGSKSESEIDVSLSGGSESDTSDLTEENLNKLEGENLSIHSQSVTSKSSSIVSESISEGSKSESEIDVSLSGGSESDTSDLTEEKNTSLQEEYNETKHSEQLKKVSFSPDDLIRQKDALKKSDTHNKDDKLEDENLEGISRLFDLPENDEAQKIQHCWKNRKAKQKLAHNNNQKLQLQNIVYQAQQQGFTSSEKDEESKWEKLRQAIWQGKKLKDLGDVVRVLQNLSEDQIRRLKQEEEKVELVQEKERLEEYISSKAPLTEVLAAKGVNATNIIRHTTDPISDAIDSAMISSASYIMPPSAVLPNIDIPVDVPDTGSTAAAAAAGDEDSEAQAKRLWTKAFISTAKQKGSNSFKTNSFGGIIGADIDIIENKLILGAAFTHADAKTKIMGSYNMNSDANLGTIYSRYYITDSLALSGDISYGLLKIKGLEKGKKSNRGGLFKGDLTLSNNTRLNSANILFTPKVGVAYDALSVKHSGGSINSSNFAGNLGLAISRSLVVSDDVMVAPSIHAQVKHVFNQKKTKIKLSATSYNGRTDLSPTDKSPKDMYNIGSSIEISKHNALTLGLGYDFHFRKSYKAHSGFVKLEVKF